ncbi:MAG: hypothetical protein WBA10_03850 [Elainellaceae cyanobacterium]
MSSIRSKSCIALSGEKWSVGNVALWQSTDDDVILFAPNQPSLARNLDNNRYQFACSQFRVQRNGAYKTVGGGALMTLDTGITYDAQVFNQLKEQWREEVLASGRARTSEPRFVPLATRKATAELLIPEISGVPSQATIDNKEFGTIGSHVSLLANLTPEGAQEWMQGIRERKNIVAGVMIRYEYLRAVPASSIRVRINGSRVFRHLSAHLNAGYDGWLYGGSLDIQAEWEKMTRNGAVTVEVFGLDSLPGGMEEMRQNIMNTFLEQAFQNFFPMLFEAKPDVKPASAGDTGGLFGGTNFALKWRKESDVSNLSLNLEFNGFSWMKSAMDADVTTLLAGLDESYINEVNTELTFPLLLNVGADEMVNSVAVSCSASEGSRPVMVPAAAAFGQEGGDEQYLVTTQSPDKVKATYKAKIDFKNPKFPIVEDSGSQMIGSDGTIVVKPSAFLGRVNIYAYVLDADGNLDLFNVSDNDQLVVNLSVSGSHLRSPVRESARIVPFPFGDAIEFTYPIPMGSAPQVQFSAFGAIGGKLVRAPKQSIQLEEDSIFIVVQNNKVTLISKESDLKFGESGRLSKSDAFVQKLIQAGTTPVVNIDSDEKPVATESGKELVTSNGNGKHLVQGTLTGVEYSKYDTAIWVETDGKLQRVMVHEVSQVEHLDDEGRKQVKVAVDETGYADTILVEL